MSLTRPNINVAPTKKHMNAVFHVLRYLKGTPEKELILKKTKEQGIEGFIDANWAGSIEDSKSTTSYCTKLWRNVSLS